MIRWNKIAPIALAALCVGSNATAAVVYDNGPVNGTISSTFIDYVQAIGNSFTLANETKITAISFGAWSDAGYALDSVEWGITDLYGVLPAFTTATLANSDVLGTVNFPGEAYEVREATFLTGGITLAAGTYYLWLRNGLGAGPSYAAGWDVNNGPSSPVFATYGAFMGPVYAAGGPGTTSSNSFKVIASSAVPEPATWGMMIIGFGAVGSMVRTSRRRNAFGTT